MNELDQLNAALDCVRYPAGMVSCAAALKLAGISRHSDGCCAIQGQSFYPGGKGYTGEHFPVGGVMYLGNFFDKIKGYADSVRRGREENLTWRNIRSAVFAHLREETVWFTNYFMGISEGETNIGAIQRVDGFPEYEEDCWKFFNLQVTLQKPKAIIALGKNVVRPLGAKNRLNIPSWSIGDNDSYGPLRMKIHEVAFAQDGRRTMTKAVAGYHPSYGRGELKISEIKRDAEFIASRVDA